MIINIKRIIEINIKYYKKKITINNKFQSLDQKKFQLKNMNKERY